MIVRVPGDKSVTQRALILAALAPGESRLSGLLPGADPRSTAGALRALGAEIPPLPDDGSAIRVRGRGLRDLRAPAAPLDLGNSGTGARLLLGVLAGQPFETEVTGDASLRSRPMRRVTEPLQTMGARFVETGDPDRLPIRVLGGELGPTELELPVASAQVKSALLLAGLVSGSFVLLTEPGRSRDHTERMFRARGVSVVTHAVAGGWRVELRDPPDRIHPRDTHVPADFSSAAFFLVLAALGGAGPEVVLPDVGLNPTRTGLLPILRRMGMEVEVEEEGTDAPTPGVGEPTGDVRVRPGRLAAVEVGPEEIPGAIDEIPILAVAAARAEGVTRITGAGELRVKETDRISALATNLRAVGVEVEELSDGLEIQGTDAPLAGRVRSFDDHRIAMAFGVLGSVPGNRIEVEGADAVGVSFPGFWSELRRVATTANASTTPSGPRDLRKGEGRGGSRAGPVVTLDGPAGSGKSSTARAVARRLGVRHLDSGALYRALTHALLDAGIDPDRWPELEPDDLAELGVSLEAAPDGFSIQRDGRTLDRELRTPAVTGHVSRVAALPAVRDWLLEIQRSAARLGGLVADGRDLGSVVFPDADLKFFLTADLDERARRRLGDQGVEAPGDEQIREEARRLRSRDRTDTERTHSPLTRPPDAVVLDTTRLDFDDQVETIVREVREWEEGRLAGEEGGPTDGTGPRG